MAGLMDGLWRRGLLSWQAGVAVVLALQLVFYLQVWLSCVDLPLGGMEGGGAVSGGYFGLVAGCSAPAAGLLPAVSGWVVGGAMGLALAAVAFWYALVSIGLMARSGLGMARGFQWRYVALWAVAVILSAESVHAVFILVWGVLVAGW